MDSVTQAALGATVAGVVAGKQCRPKHLLAGALLGTLPDMDVVLQHGDPISDMIGHRGFSHSIFVLVPFSAVLAWLWKRFTATSWSLMHVFVFCLMTLTTHPMLDAFTSYGTRFFWPIFPEPISVSSIFIIDPAYTLPLLITLVGALIWRSRAARLCSVGLLLSSVYLLWSVFAMETIQKQVEQELAGTEMADKPLFLSPTPLNTVLWRVIVRDDEQQWEALVSLLDDDKRIDWMKKGAGRWPLLEKPVRIQKFEAFTDGFVRYQEEGNTLTATDIRLGMAMYHPFRFVVADKSADGQWQEVQPIQLDPGIIVPRTIPALWMRLLGKQDIDARLCNRFDCYD